MPNAIKNVAVTAALLALTAGALAALVYAASGLYRAYVDPAGAGTPQSRSATRAPRQAESRPGGAAAAKRRPEPRNDAERAAIALHEAVRQGDIARLDRLAAELESAQLSRPRRGMTPLMAAADAGQPASVTWLLAREADADATGDRRRTALQYAVHRRQMAIVVALLDAGADIDATDAARLSPLVMATNRDYPEIAMLLIERGADVNIAHQNGYTALIDAASHGRVRVVEALLARGAVVDAVTGERWTALHLAANNGHLETVRLLLDAGADVDHEGGGTRPVQLASDQGHEDVAALLRDQPAP